MPQPLTGELLVRQRGALGRDEVLRDADAERRVRLRPRLRVVEVRAVGSGPLEVGQIDGSPPVMARSRIRASCSDVAIPALEVYQTCGFGRADIVGSTAAIASAVRLYASSMTIRSAEKPRPDPPVRVTKRSRAPECSSMLSEPAAVRMMRTRLDSCGDALDQVAHPAEVLRARLELVGAVQHQRRRAVRVGQEQRRELERLEDAALAVLAGDDQPDLERRPPPVRQLPKRLAEHELLPRVEVQAGARREVDGLRAGSRQRVRPGRDAKKPRNLRADEHAGRRDRQRHSPPSRTGSPPGR